MPLFINESRYKMGTEEPFLNYLNHSTAFCGQLQDGQWYCYVLLVLFTITVPVGVVGNMAAILNYTCFRRTGTTGTIFLLNLAVCDSAWLVLLPFTIYFNLKRLPPSSINIFCQLKKVVFNINVYGSILFLMLISFDRYAGTVYPLASLRWWDTGKAKLCAGFAWALLLLGSIPDLFVTFAFTRPENVTACMDNIQGPISYVKCLVLLRTLIGFLLPFIVILTFYASIVRVLRTLPRGGKKFTEKPLLLITAALLVFVVSFAPYHIMIVTLVIMRDHGMVTMDNADSLYAAYQFLEALCSLSCCLDPILFILASDRFQRSLQALRTGNTALCCRQNRRVGVEV